MKQEFDVLVVRCILHAILQPLYKCILEGRAYCQLHTCSIAKAILGHSTFVNAFLFQFAIPSSIAYSYCMPFLGGLSQLFP